MGGREEAKGGSSRRCCCGSGGRRGARRAGPVTRNPACCAAACWSWACVRRETKVARSSGGTPRLRASSAEPCNCACALAGGASKLLAKCGLIVLIAIARTRRPWTVKRAPGNILGCSRPPHQRRPPRPRPRPPGWPSARPSAWGPAARRSTHLHWQRNAHCYWTLQMAVLRCGCRAPEWDAITPWHNTAISRSASLAGQAQARETHRMWAEGRSVAAAPPLRSAAPW